MRLLNVHTLEFREFFESDRPPYCILSHRWGKDELTYKQFRKGVDLQGPGYDKIVNFCSFIRARKLRAPFYDAWGLLAGRSHHFVEWIWIDAICIDKRSSAELSEAINSMYKWYEQAVECHVFLADVDVSSSSQGAVLRQLSNSSWFSRGWTLQELLAPLLCIFVDHSWKIIGHVCNGCEDKMNPCCHPSQAEEFGLSLSELVSEITRIPQHCLKPLVKGGAARYEDHSIAERFSWAARRTTTRVEDEAYCLLGLLGINMPLLYGEGSMAFIRLQEEIIKRSSDSSIFAWSPRSVLPLTPVSMLARSVEDFWNSQDVYDTDPRHQERAYKPNFAFGLSNDGVQLETRGVPGVLNELDRVDETWDDYNIVVPPSDGKQRVLMLRLACFDDSQSGKLRTSYVMVAVRRMNGSFYRVVLNEDLRTQIEALFNDPMSSSYAYNSGLRATWDRFSIAAYPSDITHLSHRSNRLN